MTGMTEPLGGLVGLGVLYSGRMTEQALGVIMGMVGDEGRVWGLLARWHLLLPVLCEVTSRPAPDGAAPTLAPHPHPH
jgi:hypothetical protein